MDDRQLGESAQQQLWNGAAGHGWAEEQVVLDELFRPFERMLLDSIPADLDGAVLDVGCGTGATTLAAARWADPARCLGIDISEPMLALARSRAEKDRSKADFIRADAETYPFEPAIFARIISRFGVMFFGDPAKAFANLRRASRNGGSLRFIAWRSPLENPFMTAAERAAAPLLPNLPPRDPTGPGQFAFADREHVRSILEKSGWSEIRLEPVDVPCVLPEGKLERYFTKLGPLALILPNVPADLRGRVIEAMRAAFEAFTQDGEVRFTAACWQVDARAS